MSDDIFEDQRARYRASLPTCPRHWMKKLHTGETCGYCAQESAEGVGVRNSTGGDPGVAGSNPAAPHTI